MGGKSHQEIERERIDKNEQARNKLIEMASAKKFHPLQSVIWDADLLVNKNIKSRGVLYCPLKDCGVPIVSGRHGNHLLDKHGLKGPENEDERKSVRLLADAIADRQRSLFINCKDIPKTLIATEDQLAVWVWIQEKLDEFCVPILNRDAIPVRPTGNTMLEKIEKKVENLDKIEGKLDAILMAMKEGKVAHQHMDEVDEDDETAMAPLVDEGSLGPGFEEENDDGAADDQEEVQRVARDALPQPEDILDVSFDNFYTDHIERDYNPSRNATNRRLSEEIGFWNKLIISEQPVLLEFNRFLHDNTSDRRRGLSLKGGVHKYLSYVSRFLLVCMRGRKRLGHDMENDDFLASYSFISVWYTQIREYGAKETVVKAFCNSLSSFCAFIEKRMDPDDHGRLARLAKIKDEISQRRRQANLAEGYKDGMKGITSRGQKKPKTEYATLCAVFRSENVQERFQRIKVGFNPQTIKEDDYNYVLQGLIYAAVILNGARPEAAYKLRVGSVLGDVLPNGEKDPQTGLQEVEMLEGKLWASPYPVPKQVVAKNVMSDDMRGILIFEEVTKEWLTLYSQMRALILKSKGISEDAEDPFFVRFDGKEVGEYGVTSRMRGFLKRTGNGAISITCNEIRRMVAEETLKKVVNLIHNLLQKTGLARLQNHQVLTQLREYTANLHEVVALGYLQLRKLEKGEIEGTVEENVEEAPNSGENDDSGPESTGDICDYMRDYEPPHDDEDSPRDEVIRRAPRTNLRGQRYVAPADGHAIDDRLRDDSDPVAASTGENRHRRRSERGRLNKKEKETMLGEEEESAMVSHETHKRKRTETPLPAKRKPHASLEKLDVQRIFNVVDELSPKAFVKPPLTPRIKEIPFTKIDYELYMGEIKGMMEDPTRDFVPAAEIPREFLRLIAFPHSDVEVLFWQYLTRRWPLVEEIYAEDRPKTARFVGGGVRAASDIPLGTVFGAYYGIYVSRDEYAKMVMDEETEKKENEYAAEAPDGATVLGRTSVLRDGAVHVVSMARCNQSKVHPNAVSTRYDVPTKLKYYSVSPYAKPVFLKALIDIKKGAEILWDYGEVKQFANLRCCPCEMCHGRCQCNKCNGHVFHDLDEHETARRLIECCFDEKEKKFRIKGNGSTTTDVLERILAKQTKNGGIKKKGIDAIEEAIRAGDLEGIGKLLGNVGRETKERIWNLIDTPEAFLLVFSHLLDPCIIAVSDGPQLTDVRRFVSFRPPSSSFAPQKKCRPLRKYLFWVHDDRSRLVELSDV